VIAAHTEYVVDIRHEFFGAMVHLSRMTSLAYRWWPFTWRIWRSQPKRSRSGAVHSSPSGSCGGPQLLPQDDRPIQLWSHGPVRPGDHGRPDNAAVTFDLGTYYWTGLGTTRFAVVISNFGGDVAPEGSVTASDGKVTSTFQSFSVPTVFRLGFAFDPVATEQHRLTGAFQLDHPNDNAENFRLGLEYGWNETFFLRAGVKRTLRQSLLGEDQTTAESYSLGTGLRVPLGFASVQADYAYSDFAQLGSIHRITLLCAF